jgi:hypothetical protein
MGEKTYTKQDKEIMRKRNQQIRDEYDMQNLGDYKLVYPVKNDPVFFKHQLTKFIGKVQAF